MEHGTYEERITRFQMHVGTALIYPATDSKTAKTTDAKIKLYQDILHVIVGTRPWTADFTEAKIKDSLAGLFGKEDSTETVDNVGDVVFSIVNLFLRYFTSKEITEMQTNFKANTRAVQNLLGLTKREESYTGEHRSPDYLLLAIVLMNQLTVRENMDIQTEATSTISTLFPEAKE